MPEKEIQSYDTHLAHSIKKLFLPSLLELFLYVLAGAAVLGALNYRVFLDKIGGNSGVTQQDFNGYLHGKFTSVADFGSNLLQGRVSTMLFWAFIGSVIYMVVWTLQNLVINLENDVKGGKFVSLKNTLAAKRDYWNSVISSKVFFVCSLLTLIIYLLGLFKFLVPLTSRSFGLAISSFSFPHSIFVMILTLLFTSLLLFLLVLLGRTVAHSWRWIIGNF